MAACTMLLATLLNACAGGAPASWATFTSPAGLTVSLPPGWQPSADAQSGRVTIVAPTGARITVWPAFVPAARRFESQSAVASAVRLLGATWTGASWTTAGASAVTGRVSDAARKAVAIAVWASSPDGTSLTVYSVEAPAPSYADVQPVAAQIFQSVTMSGVPEGGPRATPAAPVLVRWEDPAERAFSVEVPAAFQTTGGAARLGSVDVRVSVRSAAPDGSMSIAIGDSTIPPMIEPSQFLAMAGYGEGSMYSPGYGQQLLVAQYQSGAEFARDHVQRFASGCAGLALSGVADRADAVRAINDVGASLGQHGVSMTTTAGELRYRCTRNGMPRDGYLFAATQFTRLQDVPGMPRLWHVPYLYAFEADQGRADEAGQLLSGMVASFQVSEQWASTQSQTALQTSRIVTRTNEAIGQIVKATFESRNRVMSEISRRRSNAMVGAVDVVDASGDTMKVESGSNYYWINNQGRIVGTDVAAAPSLDFRGLTVWP